MVHEDSEEVSQLPQDCSPLVEQPENANTCGVESPRCETKKEVKIEDPPNERQVRTPGGTPAADPANLSFSQRREIFIGAPPDSGSAAGDSRRPSLAAVSTPREGSARDAKEMGDSDRGFSPETVEASTEARKTGQSPELIEVSSGGGSIGATSSSPQMPEGEPAVSPLLRPSRPPCLEPSPLREGAFCPLAEDEAGDALAAAVFTGLPTAAVEPPPELTRPPLLENPPPGDSKRVLELITELADEVSGLAIRMDQLEDLVPVAVRQTEDIRTLSSRMQNSEREHKLHMERLRVFECERLRVTDVQKACTDTLDRHRSELRVAARQAAKLELESFERSIRWQLQMLQEDVQRMTRLQENGFANALSSLKSSWQCFNGPWCHGAPDGAAQPLTADIVAEIATNETENGAVGLAANAHLLSAKPAVDLPVDADVPNQLPGGPGSHIPGLHSSYAAAASLGQAARDRSNSRQL